MTEIFNISTHIILICILTTGIIYFISKNFKNKQFFFNNCFLYLSYLLFIIYHISSVIQDIPETFSLFCMIGGRIYLNKFLVGVISSRGNKLFDKFNYYISQCLIVVFTYFLIRDHTFNLQNNSNNILIDIIINGITVLIIIVNIFYLRYSLKIEHFRSFSFCLILMIINCVLHLLPSVVSFTGHLLNLLFSVPLYVLIMNCYNNLNNYELSHSWEVGN